VRQQHSATHYEIVMLARALCASGSASAILKNNQQRGKKLDRFVASRSAFAR
jgi:hypothetical protein